MDNLPHSSLYDQPANRTAIVLSALVHGALIAALFFGVQWKNEQPGGQPVDVYFGNPAASVLPPPLPPPPPEPEIKPKTPPPPEPKVVEKPQIDPQIAIKDKERREKEEQLKKLKLEEEKKQKEKEEKARKEEEEKKKREKKENDDRRASEITKQLENDLKRSKQQLANAERAAHEAAINAELGGLPKGSPTGSASGAQASGGAGGNRGRDEYINAIRLRIKSHAVLPPGIQGNPEAIFEVTQFPSGELISVKLTKSTGNKALDEAIERAIKKSDPLPLPKKADLFDRTLKLKYKPFDE